MTVTVIIVSYNSSALLVECVLNVLASTVPVEVIVSDNGSTDCSIEPLEDLATNDSRLQVRRNRYNLGFAKGNNVALPLATGQFVLFLNPDCLVRPTTLENLLAVLDEHPDAGMAGCLILNPDGSQEKSCARRLPTPAGLFGQLIGSATEATVPTSVTPILVEAISGAFMLVRRDDLSCIGSFDADYFMHWEDLDLCQRFRAAGRGILFVPSIEVLHFKGRSSGRQPVRIEWYKHRGLMRFFRKFHFSNWPVFLYLPIAAAIGFRFLIRAMSISLSPRQINEPMTSLLPEESQQRKEVWVFGASSLIGKHLLPRLLAAGYRVRAFCRAPSIANVADTPHLSWHAHDLSEDPSLVTLPASWTPDALVHLAPLFTLVPVLPALKKRGLSDLIAFSSTSSVTKRNSSIEQERHLAASLSNAEHETRLFCESTTMRWVIFRPTMIYSFGLDKNVTRLATFIDRFRFFPLPGTGRGLRQPVHADDLAKACIQKLAASSGWNESYNLSGGEMLRYRAMVEAIFRRLGHAPHLIHLPDGLWQIAIGLMRLLPRYRDLNMAMIRRIEDDMCFSHDDATIAFGYQPRPFQP